MQADQLSLAPELAGCIGASSWMIYTCWGCSSGNEHALQGCIAGGLVRQALLHENCPEQLSPWHAGPWVMLRRLRTSRITFCTWGGHIW